MREHAIRWSTGTCSLAKACADVKRCAGIPVPTNVSAPAGDYKVFFTHDPCRKMYQAHAKKVLNRWFLLTLHCWGFLSPSRPHPLPALFACVHEHMQAGSATEMSPKHNVNSCTF